MIEQNKKYQEQHREKIKAYNKEYMRLYYRAHRKEILEKAKQKYKEVSGDEI